MLILLIFDKLISRTTDWERYSLSFCVYQKGKKIHNTDFMWHSIILFKKTLWTLDVALKIIDDVIIVFMAI